MYMDMPNKPTLYHKNQGVTVYNFGKSFHAHHLFTYPQFLCVMACSRSEDFKRINVFQLYHQNGTGTSAPMIMKYTIYKRLRCLSLPCTHFACFMPKSREEGFQRNNTFSMYYRNCHARTQETLPQKSWIYDFGRDVHDQKLDQNLVCLTIWKGFLKKKCIFTRWLKCSCRNT